MILTFMKKNCNLNFFFWKTWYSFIFNKRTQFLFFIFYLKDKTMITKTEKLNEKLFSVKKAPMVLVFFGKYGWCYFSKYFPLANALKKYFF
jgi:hypothetical protein